jgi:hypothetical protein
MTTSPYVEIDPSTEFGSAIMGTLGDWEDHVIEFAARPNLPKNWNDDRTSMLSLLRQPLQEEWRLLSDVRKLDLRRALQYLLNLDEHKPHKPYRNSSTLREKENCLAQRIRDSCQNAVTPLDGYALCQWMWEILFGDEDWHTDITDWKVIDKTPLIPIEPKDYSTENQGVWLGQKIDSLSFLSKSGDMTKDDIQKLQIDIECGGESALSLMLCRDGTIARQGNGNMPPKKLSVMGMTEGAEFRQLMELFDEQVFPDQGVFDYSNKKGMPIRYSIAFIGERPKLRIFEFRLGLENKDVGDLLPYFDSLIKKAVVLTEPWYAKAFSESQAVQAMPEIEAPIQEQRPWWRVW